MAKNERRRTMVYSNVNKKADGNKSASNENDKIDLDNEFVIGLASFPKPDVVEKKKKKKKVKSGQVVNKKAKDEQISEKENNENHNKKTLKKIIVNQEEEIRKLPPQERIKIQKRKAIKKMSALLILLILVIGGLVYFFLSPLFNTKKVNVTNSNYISAEQIVNLSGIELNENMFKFSKKQVKKNILQNPYIESVKISRNIFTKTVNIAVEERVPTLMLEYGNSYVYINNQGYILEISAVKIDSPIVKGYVTPLEDVKPGKRLSKDDLERLETVLNIMENARLKGIDKLITHIDIKDKKDFILILESEDKTIYLGDCSDLNTQMLHIVKMLEREKGIEGEFFLNMNLNNSNPVFREKV